MFLIKNVQIHHIRTRYDAKIRMIRFYSKKSWTYFLRIKCIFFKILRKYFVYSARDMVGYKLIIKIYSLENIIFL